MTSGSSAGIKKLFCCFFRVKTRIYISLPAAAFSLKRRPVFCLRQFHLFGAYHCLLDPCERVVVFRDLLVILLDIDHIQRMGLPGDLVEAVSDGVELPHEQPVIRGRLVPGLQPVDQLPDFGRPDFLHRRFKVFHSSSFIHTCSRWVLVLIGSSFVGWGFRVLPERFAFV